MGPEVLAIGAIASTIAGTAVSASAAKSTAANKAAGIAQEAQGNSQANLYLAQVARNNEFIANRNAGVALTEGGVLSQQSNMKTRSQLGAAKVAQAASGVDVNSGSPLAVRESIENLGDLDAAMLRYKAGKESFAYKSKGLDYEAEARLDEMKASNNIAAGNIGVKAAGEAGDYAFASSIIGGASSVSDKWLSYKSKGIF